MTDLSEFFSNVEAATQPRGRGKLQPPAYDPAAMPKRAVRGFADALAPNATSLALGEPEAPMQDIPADPGNYKLPPTYDQRIPRAGAEMLSLGLGGAEAAPARAGVGMAARFAPRAVRFAPAAENYPASMAKNVAAMALGGSLATDDAGAQTGLSSKDKAQLELQRQRRAIGTEAEANRLKAANEAEAIRLQNAAAADRQRRQDELDAIQRQKQDDLAAETTRKETEARIAREQRDADDAYKAAQAKKAQEAPLRETSPNLTKALPAIGLAGAFFPPAIAKAYNQMKANKFARGFQEAVDRAEAAYAPGAPNLQAKVKTGMRKQLSEFEAAAPTKMDPTPSKWVTGLSALSPIESQLVPAEMDASTLPVGSPSQVAAWNQLTDIPLMGKRVAVGALQGIPASMLAAKLPAVGRSVRAPIEESPGVRQALMAPASRTAAPKAAPAPAPIAAPPQPLSLPPPAAAPQAGPPMPHFSAGQNPVLTTPSMPTRKSRAKAPP